MRSMPKAKNLIIANWKANPDSQTEAKKLFLDTLKLLSGAGKAVKAVIAPPAVYLPVLKGLNRGSLVSLGVQDVSKFERGSHTGEITAKSAADFSDYAIVGHSERRQTGEKNIDVAAKVALSLKAGLIAVLCVGESKRDEGGDYLDFLREQITESLAGAPKSRIKKLIMAYEPVWAIGGEEAVAPSQIYETSIFIKKILGDIYGPSAAETPVIYGGSVTAKNASELKDAEGIEGLLVGHESLRAANFASIVRIFGNKNGN